MLEAKEWNAAAPETSTRCRCRSFYWPPTCFWRQREVKRQIGIDHGTCDEGEVEGDEWTALFGWVLSVNNKQSTTSTFSTQPSQLTAIAPAEPIPPHYILLALCLLARPSQSVFRVQCLCVSPPSDLRLQRTWTPRRVRAAHPSACLVSLSLTLSLPPASPLLLCSTQRGTACCCTVSLVLLSLLLLSCPRLAPHCYAYTYTPRGVATAHSKQAAYRYTHDSTRRQEGALPCASDPGLSRTTAHVLCPSGLTSPVSCWLARQTKKEPYTHPHTTY